MQLKKNVNKREELIFHRYASILINFFVVTGNFFHYNIKKIQFFVVGTVKVEKARYPYILTIFLASFSFWNVVHIGDMFTKAIGEQVKKLLSKTKG